MPVKVKVKVEDKSEYIQIPAIALRGLVLFPDNLVSFDVGREKSIKAVETAMKGDRLIYLVPQMDFEQEDPQAEDLYEVGVTAEVRQILKLQDGVMKVLVETKERAKTVEISSTEEYISAVIKPYPLRKIRPQSFEKVEALVRSIKDAFDNFLSVSPKISKEVISNIFAIDDANELAEYIASNIIFKVEDKYELLSENSV
ncbi:MAG: LON peptidase substrate-binding domain-containing protein, partial [Firmicutes bacterium]|nr:LON peptidase substrate-binding domain-containing protein [Bacillota bacterium]